MAMNYSVNLRKIGVLFYSYDHQKVNLKGTEFILTLLFMETVLYAIYDTVSTANLY